MTMTPQLRKFALTAHLIFSIGWFGAVLSFFVLAIWGFSSQDPQRVPAAYLAMDLTGWFGIVPLPFASLLSGLAQCLWTPFRLLPHYLLPLDLVITCLS